MPINDKLTKANNGVLALPATLDGNKGTGVDTVGLNAATGWPVDSVDGPVHFALFKVNPTTDLVEDGTLTFWKATLTGTTLSNMQIKGGINQPYVDGDSALITSSPGWTNDLIEALLVSHNPDGSLKAAAVKAALGITGDTPADYNTIATLPSAVVYNGQRSYSITVPGVNLTTSLSPGSRLRTMRTVAAPTQSTSLNGTTQYWSKTAPNKMTFTDDFVVSAWVKLSSYPTGNVGIVSRYNGTSGWWLYMDSSGRLGLVGYNGSAANYSEVKSYQSLPLNKWVHIAFQLDMSAFTATPTTSYAMMDGIDIPATVARGGTNPTALVQAGNFEVGSIAGASFFPGKIAQAAVFSAKVTQATMRGYISQGLAGTETSLASAYSFNGVAIDLNTTTPNDLTANGGAVATNADSPFGTQASGLISSTIDYGIVQSVTFSTDTTVVVQVPEGCTIPTSVGISAISYSNMKAPYGFPAQKGKWQLETLVMSNTSITATINTWYNISSTQIMTPIGNWVASYRAMVGSSGASGNTSVQVALSASASSETIVKTKSMVNQSSNTQILISLYGITDYAQTSQSQLYLIIRSVSRNGELLYLQGSDSPAVLTLENAYL